ncbi:hypothetical protein EV363DRAFT_1304545 [Boletus edulis]|nr:hypothetical protein EV363DRAFT_1304545 [Boletus edulis]
MGRGSVWVCSAVDLEGRQLGSDEGTSGTHMVVMVQKMALSPVVQRCNAQLNSEITDNLAVASSQRSKHCPSMETHAKRRFCGETDQWDLLILRPLSNVLYVVPGPRSGFTYGLLWAFKISPPTAGIGPAPLLDRFLSWMLCLRKYYGTLVACQCERMRPGKLRESFSDVAFPPNSQADYRRGFMTRRSDSTRAYVGRDATDPHYKPFDSGSSFGDFSLSEIMPVVLFMGLPHYIFLLTLFFTLENVNMRSSDRRTRNRLREIEDSESTRVVHTFEEQEKATEIFTDRDGSKATSPEQEGSVVSAALTLACVASVAFEAAADF